MWKKCKPYLLSCLISLAVGGLSALLTSKSMDLYEEINTPPLAPPMVLFPIVWSILFLLMGISAARVYNKRQFMPGDVKDALSVYAMSLVVNFTWSIIFFNYRAFWAAFVWLLLLLVLIVRTVMLYARIDKPAAYLQIPYLAWVAFAGYLNLAIAILNP